MEQTKKEKGSLAKIVLAVVAILLLAALIAAQYFMRTFSTYRIVRETEIAYEGESKTEKLNNCMLIYNKDGVRCMTEKGAVAWDISYQIQNPCVAVDGGTAAFAGYGDHTVYVVNESGMLGEIDTNLPIRNLCVSDAGYVGTVLDDNDVYWIYVYSAKGEEMARLRTTMAQSGYPLSIDLSSNGKLLAVSYLYLDAATVETNVAFYNLGEVGQNYEGQYMSGYIYEEIIPHICYMNNTTAVGISNDRLIFYEGSEKPVAVKDIFFTDTVQAVFWGNENVILVYNGTSQEGRYRMQVYDLSGELILEQGFDLDYSDILSQDNVITVYNSSEILVMTTDGKERFSGSLGDNIRSMEAASSKYKYNVLFEEAYRVIELE